MKMADLRKSGFSNTFTFLEFFIFCVSFLYENSITTRKKTNNFFMKEHKIIFPMQGVWSELSQYISSYDL